MAIATTIEYEDNLGRPSRRRINLHRIHESDGARYIDAYCLERKDIRTFRVDRIVCFITDDGEVVEPARFLANPRQFSDSGGITLTARIIPPPEDVGKIKDPRWIAIPYWVWTCACLGLAALTFSDSNSAGAALGVFAILWVPVYIIRWIVRKIFQRR